MSSAPIGQLVAGVLSTGLKVPAMPYKGDSFDSATLYCRVAVAPRGQAITVQFKRNGANWGTAVSIADGAQTGSQAQVTTINDGDRFEVNITQVGNDGPNEGSDLVWEVAR